MVQLHNQSADDSFDGPEGIWECSDSEPEATAPPKPASPKNFNFSPPKTLKEAVQSQPSAPPKKFAFESPKDIVEKLKKTPAVTSQPARVLRATNRRPWTSTSSESSSRSSSAPKKRGRPPKSTKKTSGGTKNSSAKTASAKKQKNPILVEKAFAQKRKNGRFVKEDSSGSSRTARRVSADSGVVESAEHSPARVALLANDVVEDDAVKLEPVDYEYETQGDQEQNHDAAALAVAVQHENPVEATRPVIINSRLIHTQLHGVIVSNSHIENCTILGGQVFGPLVINQ